MDVSAGPKTGTVGVLVCTHHASRIPMLGEAVASLRAQSRTPDALLVMVDGEAALAEEVRTALPDVDVACTGRNQGVSYARTEGARRMRTDWVVFMDDDALAEPDWLEQLTSPLGEPDVLGASGRSLPLFDAPRPAWLPDEYLWAFGCSFRGLPDTTTRVRNFFGGAAAVRREVFLDLGGYSTELGHAGRFVGGGEEALFCQRATQATGGTFVFVPAAAQRHHLPPDRLTWRYLTRRCFGEGVMKRRLQRLLPGDETLGDERAFALRLPGQALGHVLHGRPLRAVGIVVATLAVLAGLAYESVAGLASRGSRR